ncbi:hypothetical protein [Flavobacterium soli]|uniref:hypothetical protein n=1 Tax=Flavobacterium soli TaxID=344881 RepID=UPI0004179440|nr:hypothetical protein [Flavobacterium soli]
MNENNLLELKKDIFYRATLFIEDMGEFSPFGSELLENEIKPVMIFDDAEEVSKGVKWIDILIDSFSKKIFNNEIQAGAIAYDVSANFKNADGVYEKRDALCLKISTDGESWSEEYFPYMVIEGKCIWS